MQIVVLIESILAMLKLTNMLIRIKHHKKKRKSNIQHTLAYIYAQINS